ncbi:MAG: hypothetical protein NTX50_10040 [Candidatus Sumerlaeota bacterium]|nr:hypothetical protein [Candidatus Sumerlaeota bacterium]
MSYVKTIVCFANSRKMNERCIAGKELQNSRPGEWIRPVSDRATHEISKRERRYENGREPQLLDIIRVPCSLHDPIAHQHENHIIAPGRWKKLGQLTWKAIDGWLDTPDTLWGLKEKSYGGINNRVSVGWPDGTSLYLIGVESLQIIVERNFMSEFALWGKFDYHGQKYRLSITDPVIERIYFAKSEGQYEITRAVLCVSLGDLFKGHYYKLIAGVLYAERFK